MKFKSSRNRLKLIVLFCATTLCSYDSLVPANADIDQQRPVKALEIVGTAVPLDQRQGVDDGAVLAVHFSGDTHGTLETCG